MGLFHVKINRVWFDSSANGWLHLSTILIENKFPLMMAGFLTYVCCFKKYASGPTKNRAEDTY